MIFFLFRPLAGILPQRLISVGGTAEVNISFYLAGRMLMFWSFLSLVGQFGSGSVVLMER